MGCSRRRKTRCIWSTRCAPPRPSVCLSVWPRPSERSVFVSGRRSDRRVGRTASRGGLSGNSGHRHRGRAGMHGGRSFLAVDAKNARPRAEVGRFKAARPVLVCGTPFAEGFTSRASYPLVVAALDEALKRSNLRRELPLSISGVVNSLHSTTHFQTTL